MTDIQHNWKLDWADNRTLITMRTALSLIWVIIGHHNKSDHVLKNTGGQQLFSKTFLEHF